MNAKGRLNIAALIAPAAGLLLSAWIFIMLVSGRFRMPEPESNQLRYIWLIVVSYFLAGRLLEWVRVLRAGQRPQTGLVFSTGFWLALIFQQAGYLQGFPGRELLYPAGYLVLAAICALVLAALLRGEAVGPFSLYRREKGKEERG